MFQHVTGVVCVRRVGGCVFVRVRLALREWKEEEGEVVHRQCTPYAQHGQSWKSTPPSSGRVRWV
jgi:hypothetical protein